MMLSDVFASTLVLYSFTNADDRHAVAKIVLILRCFDVLAMSPYALACDCNYTRSVVHYQYI
jgi:hypothetical protein